MPGTSSGHPEEDDSSDPRTPVRITKSFDELTASPLVVEPYPPRPTTGLASPIPDTPSRHRLEGVYDRFLMATSGVKRVGKGYQSDIHGPIQSYSQSNTTHSGHNNHRAFYTARRAMPPPVSSDDQRMSVDELGMMTYSGTGSPNMLKDDTNNPVTLVRRALKAIGGKSVSRRLSRMG